MILCKIDFCEILLGAVFDITLTVVKPIVKVVLPFKQPVAEIKAKTLTQNRIVCCHLKMNFAGDPVNG